MNPVGYIYLVTNTVNRKRYVGCTIRSVSARWSQQKSLAKSGGGYALHSALRKYGYDQFTVECIETVHGTHADLMAAEVRQIELQGSTVPAGYNLTKGGEGVDYSIPEIREKQLRAIRSWAATPESREAMQRGAQKRLADPEWRKHNLEQLQRQHACPEWQAARAAGLVKAHSDPELIEKHKQAVDTRSTNQEWVKNTTEANRRKATDPKWLEATREASRKKSADPKWHAAIQEGANKRSADPEWRKNTAEAAKRRASDPAWIAANLAARQKQVLAQDALCSPEERERRVRERANRAAKVNRLNTLLETDEQ